MEALSKRLTYPAPQVVSDVQDVEGVACLRQQGITGWTDAQADATATNRVTRY
jgi:hypothetical protein